MPPALIAAGLPAGSVADFLAAIPVGTPAAFKAVQGLTPTIQAAGLHAYRVANSEAYKTVFLTTLAFSGIGIVLSLFYPSVDHLITNQVTVQVKQVHLESSSAESVESVPKETAV